MHFRKYFVPLAIAIVISSCMGSKQVSQLKHGANGAFEANDFQTALNNYDSLIMLSNSRGKQLDGSIYRNAGIAAWEVGQTQKTLDYIEKAKERNSADAKAYFVLAKAYLKVDNLSREIINLDTYIDRFPEGNEINQVRCQLYMAYVKSTNWELAKSLWESIDGTCKESIKTQIAYLKMLLQDSNSKQIMATADAILKKEPMNTIALEAIALEFYNMAEVSYQEEMKAYQKSRTNKQYRQLLNALEVINANFQKSRDYFERLYKINPDPRYANYLGNIYTRFENKQKADEYYRKAKQ